MLACVGKGVLHVGKKCACTWSKYIFITYRSGVYFKMSKLRMSRDSFRQKISWNSLTSITSPLTIALTSIVKEMPKWKSKILAGVKGWLWLVEMSKILSKGSHQNKIKSVVFYFDGSPNLIKFLGYLKKKLLSYMHVNCYLV